MFSDLYSLQHLSRFISEHCPFNVAPALLTKPISSKCAYAAYHNDVLRFVADLSI